MNQLPMALNQRHGTGDDALIDKRFHARRNAIQPAGVHAGLGCLASAGPRGEYESEGKKEKRAVPHRTASVSHG